MRTATATPTAAISCPECGHALAPVRLTPEATTASRDCCMRAGGCGRRWVVKVTPLKPFHWDIRIEEEER